MRSTINMVRGAIAKNDAIPILTQFHVYSGRIQGSNGRITVDAPCEELKNLNFTCPVKEFLLAIDNCENEPNLTVKDNKLTVTSGKFKASLATIPEEYPVMSVDKSQAIPVQIKILPVLRTLQPFISTDANRAWSCGIFFDGENAYATNNVVMLTTPCDDIGQINLSAACVEELLRIGEEPQAMLPEMNSITFFYTSGAWLKANTLSTNWPDVSAFIPTEVSGIKLTEAMKRDINKVALFAGKSNRVHLNMNGISTEDRETTVDDYDFPDSWFNAVHLCNVVNIAKEISLSSYPKPCAFIGDNVRGVIIGVLPQ